MPKGIRLPIFAFLSLASALSADAQNASATPANFSQIGEVVGNWSADQHLWVNGRLPVSDSHLAGLEQWLDANAPNWTVVLMQNARGQTFKNYRGMDAIEHALGKQLANQTDFGSLKDTRTGESNGAFFILFLEERKFSYYGSDAFDTRNLGENRWVGRLDKPAIAAMRGGGRVVDAVRDTITSIESQLTGKIESEKAAKQRAAIERQRSIEEARQLSGLVAAEVDRAEEAVAGFRAQHPAATGDLVQLPLASWRGGVRAIADYAGQEDPVNARKLADQIRGEIGEIRGGLVRWEKDQAELERLAARLEKIEAPGEVPSVQGHLARAMAALESAKENHAAADKLYREQIDAADGAIDQAEAEIGAWQAAVRAEQRRLEARRKMAQFLTLAGIVLFLIGLIVLNRLRAPAKKEARKALREWQSKLQGKFDQLFKLMDRASVIVGPSSQLESRGYDGETLKLCRESIHEVDELFIMSAATDGVIDRVEKLIEPKSPWGLLVNAFFSRRYRRATGLLGSKPIGFDRDQGLEAILQPAQKINPEAAERSLLGDPEDYEPFRMSFEQLIAAYDEKQSAAISKVDRLEHCIDGLPMLLGDLNARHDDVSDAASALTDASAEDGFFPMENLRNQLLPAVSRHIENATETGRADPVTAMENPAAEADRQLGSAQRLTAGLEKVRGDDFVKVEGWARELESFGHKVAWIDDYYAGLTNQGEQIAGLTADRAVDDDLAEFEDDLLRMRGRVSSCAALARRADEEVAPAIESSAAEADATRVTLAEKLRISPLDVLAEEDLSPFTKIEEARKELAAARAAIDRGNMEAAQEDFREIEKSLEESAGLLELSREVADSHGERHQVLTANLRDTLEQQPRTANLLKGMTENYDPAILQFSTRTGQPARGQDSIRDSVNRADTRLESAGIALDESAAAFTRGHLIAAGGLLERAGNEIGFARHQLSLIEDQHAALKDAETKNPTDLAALRRRHEALADSIADRRTMIPTIEQHRAIGVALSSIEADLTLDRPNPFDVALHLDHQEKELNAVEHGIEADRELYDSASAAISHAKRQLADAETLARKALGDRIPDSPQLEGAIAQHDRLGESLAEIERALSADHGDWHAVNESASRVSAEILTTREIMAAELRAAEAAVAELKRAASSISQLKGWRSRHQVSVDRRAGYDIFAEARNALAAGDYHRAGQFALSARTEANLTLTRARNRERAEERAEARRRQRQASSFSSGSSFGSSGGSSFSSGGGSSGFSSGSFSSGSGVSRSGW